MRECGHGRGEGGQKGKKRGEVDGEEIMREQDGQSRGRTESKSKENHILIEGIIMGLARKRVLENFPEIHKNDSN